MQIADLSASGALLFLEGPPPAGSEGELWIEGFGRVPIRIVHTGQHYCGVTIVNPGAYRDQLLDWLRQKIVTDEPTSAVG